MLDQFNAIQVMEPPTQDIPLDLKRVLFQYQQVFEAPKGLSPTRGEHDHGISGSEPLNVQPLLSPFGPKE